MEVTQDRLTQHEKTEPSEALNLCVLLGRILFNFGAGAQRIKDGVAVLARHLGCKVDMAVTYEAQFFTVDDNETSETRVDSSQRFARLNLLGLIRISEWIADLPRSRSTPSELASELSSIRDAPDTHRLFIQAFAAGCAGACFCIVNGGDPISWMCSFLGSMLIFAVRRPLGRKFNFHLTLFAAALAGSLFATLLGRMAHTATPAIALIAPLLFLVPGMPLITGGVEILRNHVTIGLARIGFAVAVLVALCMAVGVTLPMLPSRMSPPFSLPDPWGLVLFSMASGVAAGALAFLNNGSGSLILLCAVGGLTARLVRGLVTLDGFDLITASLVGAICSTLVVGFIGNRRRWPAVLAAVMAALPMVPGYFAIDGMQSLLAFSAARGADPGQLAVALHALSRAVFISVALIVGVVGPLAVLRHDTER